MLVRVAFLEVNVPCDASFQCRNPLIWPYQCCQRFFAAIRQPPRTCVETSPDQLPQSPDEMRGHRSRPTDVKKFGTPLLSQASCTGMTGNPRHGLGPSDEKFRRGGLDGGLPRRRRCPRPQGNEPAERLRVVRVVPIFPAVARCRPPFPGEREVAPAKLLHGGSEDGVVAGGAKHRPNDGLGEPASPAVEEAPAPVAPPPRAPHDKRHDTPPASPNAPEGPHGEPRRWAFGGSSKKLFAYKTSTALRAGSSRASTCQLVLSAGVIVVGQRPSAPSFARPRGCNCCCCCCCCCCCSRLRCFFSRLLFSARAKASDVAKAASLPCCCAALSSFAAEESASFFALHDT